MKLGLKTVIGVAAVMIAGFTTPQFLADETLQFLTPIVLGVIMGASIILSERHSGASPI